MLNIGVVGVGNWGKNHARILRANTEIRLSALCDSDESRLKPYKQLYPDIKFSGDPQEIAKNKSIDSVLISTPANTHAAIAEEMLLNGKDVFIEKPMTLSSDSAQKLNSIAKKQNKIIMVGHLLMYHPAVEFIKNYIDSGELGKVYYINSQRVNLGVIRQDENVLWSLGPHDISIISYLFDEDPSSVYATGSCHIQPGIQDVVFIHLHYPGGKIASIHLSWLNPHKLRQMTIVGSKKMIVFDDMESNEKIKIFDKGVKKPNYESFGELIGLRFGDILIPHVENREPLRSELDHFINCVKTRSNPRSDGENGLRVIKILERADKLLKA